MSLCSLKKSHYPSSLSKPKGKRLSILHTQNLPLLSPMICRRFHLIDAWYAAWIWFWQSMFLITTSKSLSLSLWVCFCFVFIFVHVSSSKLHLLLTCLMSCHMVYMGYGVLYFLIEFWAIYMSNCVVTITIVSMNLCVVIIEFVFCTLTIWLNLWLVSSCWLYGWVNTLTLKDNKNIKYLKNCKLIN